MSYLKTFLPYLFGNKKGKSYELPQSIDWGSLKFEETLMFHALKGDLQNFLSTLSLKDLTPKDVYHLMSFDEFLPEAFKADLYRAYPEEGKIYSKAIKGEVLFSNDVQDILNYKTHTLSLFALFSKDRTKPGKLFIRKKNGEFYRKENGDIWCIRTLATSGRGLPFNHSNGATPSGVYTIDSVMPEANNHYEFGAHRRLIVNFLKGSSNEGNIKQFLPHSHRERSWWKPSLVAREMGRSLLRIHGTGRVNKNPFSSYFPMIPSSGCLTTTERSFWGMINISDQRLLLDALMDSMGLAKSYENESKIHGLLYVIDFDGTYQALEF